MKYLVGLFVGDLDAAHAIAQQLPQLVLEHPAKTTNTQNQYSMMGKKNRSREGSEKAYAVPGSHLREQELLSELVRCVFPHVFQMPHVHCTRELYQ